MHPRLRRIGSPAVSPGTFRSPAWPRGRRRETPHRRLMVEPAVGTRCSNGHLVPGSRDRDDSHRHPGWRHRPRPRGGSVPEGRWAFGEHTGVGGVAVRGRSRAGTGTGEVTGRHGGLTKEQRNTPTLEEKMFSTRKLMFAVAFPLVLAACGDDPVMPGGVLTEEEAEALLRGTMAALWNESALVHASEDSIVVRCQRGGRITGAGKLPDEEFSGDTVRRSSTTGSRRPVAR